MTEIDRSLRLPTSLPL